MATYYLQTNGDDANNGSEFAPFATLNAAAAVAVADDLVIVRGGEYLLSADQDLDAAGASGTPIIYRAEENEEVVLNFQDNAAVTVGLDILADWQVIKRLQVANVIGAGSDGIGIAVRQDNNRIEQCRATGCSDAGLTVIGDGGTQIPAANHIIDFDAVDNAGDGVQFLTDIGIGNQFVGGRCWRNTEGVILTNANQPVLFHSSWFWDNLANGLVLGPGSAAHVVTECIAALNALIGFENNASTGLHVVTNNSAHENGGDNYEFNAAVAAVLRNNLSLNGTETINAAVDDANNSFNSLDAVAGELISEEGRSQLSRARLANGGLRQIDYLRPKLGGGLSTGGESSFYIGALEPQDPKLNAYIEGMFKSLPRHKEREYRAAYDAIVLDVQNLNDAIAKVVLKLNADAGVTDTDYLKPVPTNCLSQRA